MRIGPDGEKRPADPVASAHLVARIATGLAEEQYVDDAKAKGGPKGGKARAEALTSERSEIGKAGAKARWG